MIISHSKITEFYKQEGPKINGTALMLKGAEIVRTSKRQSRDSFEHYQCMLSSQLALASL